MLDTKESVLASTIAEIERRFGAGTMKFASEIKAADLDYISTGSMALDYAMGGGFPRRKITVLYGDYSVGKSTMCLYGCASAQKEGHTAAFMKMENWLPPDYAKALGVDMDRLLVVQSVEKNQVSGEQVLAIAENLMRSGVPIVVVDSIPALIPQRQIESDIGDKNYAAIAALLSDTLKKLSDAADYGNSALVFTSQVRQTIGAKAYHGYQPVHMYGGKAILHYSDIIVKLTRQLDKETREEQQVVRAIVEKNRLNVPQREAEFTLEYGKGVDHVAEVFDTAVDKGVIKDSGSGRFGYNDTKWRGRDKVLQSLRENTELRDEIEKEVRK